MVALASDRMQQRRAEELAAAGFGAAPHHSYPSSSTYESYASRSMPRAPQSVVTRRSHEREGRERRRAGVILPRSVDARMAGAASAVAYFDCRPFRLRVRIAFNNRCKKTCEHLEQRDIG